MRYSRALIIAASLIFLTSKAYCDGILQHMIEGTSATYMPLIESDVSVEINGQVAITTIENTFNNTEPANIDVKYHFPVPVSASVTGFGFYDENGQLQMYTIEPGQQGGTGGGAWQNPSLEDYLGENPFSIAVNDVPHGEITFYFQYSALLDYSFGDIMMEYPLYTPSYFVLQPTQTITIGVDIVSQRIITDVFCNNYSGASTSHAPYSGTASMTLSNTYPPEDFDLNYTVSQEDIGCWLLTSTEPDSLPDSDDGYFLLIMEPGELQPGSVVQKYFTFIMDKSGSMAGNNLVQAKAAAIACIQLLGEEDYFNIIDFNNSVYRFRPDPVIASSENLQLAENYISAISAAGGTNIYSALMAGLNQQMGVNSANQIIFLTDGVPTSGITGIGQIINDVTAANTDTAGIFCFGIGSNLSVELLEGLALNNWGSTFYIEPGQVIGEEVVEFFMSVMNPVFINVQVDYGSIITREIYPPDIANIYYGSQTLVFGRYVDSGFTSISLSGTVAGYDTTIVYTGFEFPEENLDNEFLPRMWAIEYINYWIAWMTVNGEEDEIIDQIIFYSLKYGILTPYTQFEPPVGVETLYVYEMNGTPCSGGTLLTWNLNRYEPEITYDLYRADNASGPFLKLNTAPLTDNSFTDYSAEPGRVYYYKVNVHAIDGSVFSGVFTIGEIPENMALSQNYPNPFNASTSLSFNIIGESIVRLEIFNLIGQRVKSLVNDVKGAGTYQYTWDTLSDGGVKVASGQYFYRLTVEPLNGGDKFVDVKKLILLN